MNNEEQVVPITVVEIRSAETGELHEVIKLHDPREQHEHEEVYNSE